MLAEVRQALADRLSEIEELNAQPYMLAEPIAPAAHVFPTPVDYDETFQRGSDDWTFTVQVFVSDGTGSQVAQIRLDEYIEPVGPRSVKAKLEEPDAPDGSVTLGGLIDDLHVTRCEGYRLYQREGRAPVLGSEWIVKVSASGREEE